MKLLMVNSGVFPIPSMSGGTENHVYYLTKALSKFDMEIDLVSDVNTNINLQNVKIHNINLPKLRIYNINFYGYILRHLLGGFLAFLKVRQLLSRNSYDLIHTHGRVAPFLLSLCRLNIPMIFTLHDDPPIKAQSYYNIYRLSYKILQENAFKKSDQIIAIHKNVIQHCISLNIDKKKISLIPNGVDVNFFKYNENRNKNKLLFVGFLSKRKGLQYAINALNEINNITLTIIGNGPEKNNLINLVKYHNLEDRIEFIGNVPLEELPRYYASASFLILPSLREGLPLVVLEAMSCGLPVIASNTSGLKDIIKHGFNGFLFQPGNVDDIKKTIQLSFENYELQREMSVNSRDFVESFYNWDKIAIRIKNLYKVSLKSASKEH